MYEQPLLCGIMNDWYGSMEDLLQDLKHYGFEVLESWSPTVKASRYPATMMAIMFRSSWFLVEPSERSLLKISKKFIARRLRAPVLNRRWQVRSLAGRSAPR